MIATVRKACQTAQTGTPRCVNTGGAGFRKVWKLVTSDWSRYEASFGLHTQGFGMETQWQNDAMARFSACWKPGGSVRSQPERWNVSNPITFTTAYNSERRRAVDLAVWGKSEGRCWYCGRQVELFATNPDDRMCIDHVVSQSDGGGDDLTNLVPACKSCNSSKGRRSVEDFRWTAYRKANGIPNFGPAHRQWLVEQGFVFVGLSDTRFWFELEGLSW